MSIRRVVGLVLFLVPLSLAGCAAVEGHAWSTRAELRYLYGEIRGQLQTPTGGNPGTTSLNRPTLSELGFDHASVADVSGAADFRDHRVFAGYRFVRLSGKSVLDEPLISQGHAFSADTTVNADVALDWFRAGYAHRFLISLPGENRPDLALYPSIGVTVLNFDYRLRQQGPGAAHRSYILPAPQIGLSAEWPLTRQLSVTAQAGTSIDVSNNPVIWSGELAGRYRVYEGRGMRVEAMLGVGYDRIRYDDSGKQTVPNQIDVRFGPALLTGLSIRF